MRHRKDDYGEVRINMDPMIDCVFLLIIFFLTTTVFIKPEQDLAINLPTVGPVKKPPASPILVNVRYLPGGNAYYHVNNERMSLTALTMNLTRAKMREKEQAVVIRGDENVKWDNVAQVMACCGSAGITKVSAMIEAAE